MTNSIKKSRISQIPTMLNVIDCQKNTYRRIATQVAINRLLILAILLSMFISFCIDVYHKVNFLIDDYKTTVAMEELMEDSIND